MSLLLNAQNAAMEDASCKCGLAVRSNRIVGGTETEVNEYPWQIAMTRAGV